MTATNTPPLVANLDQLEMTYDGSGSAVRALRRVESDLYRDEFVVVLGPSGSGKTTRLNVTGGIETPTSGHTIVAGARYSGCKRSIGETEPLRIVVAKPSSLAPVLSLISEVDGRLGECEVAMNEDRTVQVTAALRRHVATTAVTLLHGRDGVLAVEREYAQ